MDDLYRQRILFVIFLLNACFHEYYFMGFLDVTRDIININKSFMSFVFS